ncbi:hypothetical protein [uncultured Cocleimonas sp.]|nr:hypothetical protein [uncultured Cocleimonas sp.]
MKFVNKFTKIRGILYIAVIVSCFTFTPAKSEPINDSASFTAISQ